MDAKKPLLVSASGPQLSAFIPQPSVAPAAGNIVPPAGTSTLAAMRRWWAFLTGNRNWT